MEVYETPFIIVYQDIKYFFQLFCIVMKHDILLRFIDLWFFIDTLTRSEYIELDVINRMISEV
jgi:hypothetical protein